MANNILDDLVATLTETFDKNTLIKQNTEFLTKQLSSISTTFLEASARLGIDRDTAFRELMMTQALTLTDTSVGYKFSKEEVQKLVDMAYDNSVTYRDKMVAEGKISLVEPTHEAPKSVN